MDYISAVRLLQENDNFLIITHINPDGDTIGSSAALCSALRRKGKNAFLYNNPDISNRFSPYVSEFIINEDISDPFVISVDISTEKLFPKGFNGSVYLAFDHHPSYSYYAEEYVLKDRFSCCGEVIYEIISRMCGDITAKEADLLYIALSTDTGCFLYANTDSHSFMFAAKLLKAGADSAEINDIFFRKLSRSRIILEGLIYSSMRFYSDNTICVVTLTQKDLEVSGADEDDMADIASFAMKTKGTKVGITIREKTNGTCRVSVRSTGDISSNEICSAFGGGGHRLAAGCTIASSILRAEEMLVAVTQEVMK